MTRNLFVGLLAFILVGISGCKKEEPHAAPQAEETIPAIETAEQTPTEPQENKAKPVKAAPIASADLVGVWTENASEGLVPTIFTLKSDGKCMFQDMMNTTPRTCSYKVLSPEEAGGNLNKLVVNVDASDEYTPFERSENIRLDGEVLVLVDGDSEWKYSRSEIKEEAKTPEPVTESTPYEKIPDSRIPVPLDDKGKPAKYAEFIPPNEAATETDYIYKNVSKSFESSYINQLKKAGFKQHQGGPKYIKSVKINDKEGELMVQIDSSEGKIKLMMWAVTFGE